MPSVDEISEEYGLSAAEIEAAVHAGELRATRDEDGMLVIRSEDIEEFLGDDGEEDEDEEEGEGEGRTVTVRVDL